eukprot:366320-Chlamydomonas_euryale.AAC.4
MAAGARLRARRDARVHVSVGSLSVGCRGVGRGGVGAEVCLPGGASFDWSACQWRRSDALCAHTVLNALCSYCVARFVLGPISALCP